MFTSFKKCFARFLCMYFNIKSFTFLCFCVIWYSPAPKRSFQAGEWSMVIQKCRSCVGNIHPKIEFLSLGNGHHHDHPAPRLSPCSRLELKHSAILNTPLQRAAVRCCNILKGALYPVQFSPCQLIAVQNRSLE